MKLIAWTILAVNAALSLWIVGLCLRERLRGVRLSGLVRLVSGDVMQEVADSLTEDGRRLLVDEGLERTLGERSER